VNPELTVLVPFFNEEENLRRNLPVLVEAARACTPRHEILLVDDGSSDSGLAVVEAFMAGMRDRRRVRLVRHPRNLGPGAAIPTGVFWARGDWVMLVPADLACHPSELPGFYQARQGADLVVGLRSDRRDNPLWRRMLSQAYIATLRTLGGSAVRQFNYLQLYKRELFARLKVRSRGVFVTAEIILQAERAGLTLAQVPLTYLPRQAGRASGASPAAMLRTLMEMAGHFAFGREGG
jgi:glycosyltransferase involved in cell wall biosynthesis